MPASTIRNWAKRDRVANQLDLREEGPRRMVDLADVTERARKLGRLEPKPEPVDQWGPPAPPTSATPDDAMLVPIDAWNRMLNQLGNLHEAGQQLAAARERAAKAETEATFLRERMAELREELTEAKSSTRPPVVEEPPSAPAPVPKTRWWVGAYRRWRPRRSRDD